MYDIYDVSIFFLLVLSVMYWWRISEQKTHALSVASKHCEERDVQLLDQTLVFKRFAFVEDRGGHKRFCRIYEFDFSSDGETRHKGEVTLTAHAVIRIVLAADMVEITDF